MSSGDNIEAKTGRWSFGGNVSQNFSAHINRSVPLYLEGHEIITHLTDFFVSDNSICYDLGSSNGDLTLKLADHNKDKNANFIGIEVEKSMVARANSLKGPRKNLHYIEESIIDFEYEPADLMVSYYTIQFINPKVRQHLINQIYNSLNWGGAFLFFEKVRAPDARFQDIATTLYLEFKKSNDYTNDEILEKLFSLKGVLEPFSSQGNIDLMERAGFKDILPIMKYICFEGYLAIK